MSQPARQVCSKTNGTDPTPDMQVEGATETMRQEQERRARVFNSAVKAAVQRVQVRAWLAGAGAGVGARSCVC